MRKRSLFVVNQLKLFILIAISTLFSSCNTHFDESKLIVKTDYFTDTRDGKTYNTIQIDGQVWFAQNLAYKTENGCYIFTPDDSKIKMLPKLKDENYITKNFGYLYNWETACDVCPEGWHLPSDYEWNQLAESLGGPYSSGARLKDTIFWFSLTTDSLSRNTNNISQFSARPGGIANNDNSYVNILHVGYWWSTTEKRAMNASGKNPVAMVLNYSRDDIRYTITTRENGMSVRCIKNK